MCQPIIIASDHDCRLQGSTQSLVFTTPCCRWNVTQPCGHAACFRYCACCRSAVKQKLRADRACLSVVVCCRWAGTQSCAQRSLRWRWSMRTAASPVTRLQRPRSLHKVQGRGTGQPADESRHLSCAGRLLAQHWLRHLILCSGDAHQQAAALHAHCTFQNGQ